MKDRLVNIRIDSDVYKKIQRQAELTGLSVSDYIRLMSTLEFSGTEVLKIIKHYINEFDNRRLSVTELLKYIDYWEGYLHALSLILQNSYNNIDLTLKEISSFRVQISKYLSEELNRQQKLNIQKFINLYGNKFRKEWGL